MLFFWKKLLFVSGDHTCIELFKYVLAVENVVKLSIYKADISVDSNGLIFITIGEIICMAKIDLDFFDLFLVVQKPFNPGI